MVVVMATTFFSNSRKDMACTKCKKKTTIESVVSSSEISPKPECRFRLKGIVGIIQMSFGSGQFISNANLTNELAINFLKANPNRISMFEVYPENWKDLLNTKNNDEDVVDVD